LELEFDSKNDAVFEYKYFIQDKKTNEIAWEKGVNRKVDLS